MVRSFALTLVAITFAALGAEDEGFTPLYNGKDLTGWHAKDGKIEAWKADGEVVACVRGDGGWLTSDKEYSDFVLKVDWKLPKGGNSGVGLRYPAKGDPAHVGMEIQVLDDAHPSYAKLDPAQYCGGIYYQVAADKEKKKLNPPGEWNSYEITCKGPQVIIKLNGIEIVNANMDENKVGRGGHKALADRPKKGFVGLQCHGSRVEFKNILIKEL